MTSTSTDEPRDMWRLHILDLDTHKMIVVECSKGGITRTVRSYDPLRYELRYLEDTSPATPLTGLCC